MEKNKEEVIDDKINILIAEDSPTQAEQLRYILEMEGYEVSVARNGKEALPLLSKSRPTAVISDIVMPEMDGYQLCRQIKADKDLRSIPVILLTSLSDPSEVVKALECGADNYIIKPYDKKYLLSRIRYMLLNFPIGETDKTQMGVEIYFSGQKYLITSERKQILDIFLSTYETAVQKNQELIRVQEELKLLNEQLEKRVRERTADLARANEELQVEIAERKLAEDALQRSQARLQLQIDRMPIGCIMWNPEFRVLSWNPAAEKIFRFTEEETLGKHSYDLIVPKEVQSHVDVVWHRLLEGDATAHSVNENITKDGRIIICEWTNTPIKEADGTVVGVLSMVQDITERKRAEEEKKGLEEQLRQSQKMEAIGRLAGGIAHDFNNLLTIIKGNSQLSLMELKAGDPLRENIEEVEKAADRAAALTRQLLAFSRRQVFEMRVLDLNTTLRELEKMLRRVIGEDIGLVTLLAENLGTVKADPGQIEQVVMNLAVNARDAMPKGGKLTIETTNVELDKNYARNHVAVTPGSYVMLSVSDTGVGMPPEVKAKIFEPFFTTKEKGRGTGLGLSMVYGIVKQSGGNIWVYSEPGQGTAFKIYLPRVDEPPEEAGEKVVQKELPGGGETILVVEDEEKVRQVTVQILTKNGYTVLEASHGDGAKQICEQHGGPIHLIMTDVVLPGMNGRELAECLVSGHPGAKVLYMSGYTDDAIVHHGVLEKGLHFLQKPFNLEYLLKKVREVLEK